MNTGLLSKNVEIQFSCTVNSRIDITICVASLSVRSYAYIFRLQTCLRARMQAHEMDHLGILKIDT
jgi:hypothetical protein